MHLVPFAGATNYHSKMADIRESLLPKARLARIEKRAREMKNKKQAITKTQKRALYLKRELEAAERKLIALGTKGK